ncbi:MAG: ABC transporter substrate-binding protein [bacterium]
MRKILALIAVSLLAMAIVTVAAPVKLLIEQDYWSEETGTAGKAIVAMMRAYEKKNPDVKIEHVYVPFGQLVEKILMQTMTKSLPDIVFVDNPDLPHVAEAGSLLDITPRVKAWGQWDDFYPGPQSAVTLGGKIYAFHMVTNNLALYYNPDLLTQAGLPGPPETWDELVLYAGKLTKGDRYGIAFSAVNTEEATWQFEPFLWSNGGDLFKLDQPEAAEALELWVTLVKKGYASKDVVNWNQGDVSLQFRTRKAALIVQGCWDIPTIQADGIPFGIARIPTPKRGMIPVVPMGGECFGISPFTTSDKQEEAWKFISWLAEPEQILELNLLISDLPTRKSAAAEAAKRSPILKPFIDQLERAVSRSAAGGGTKYTQVSAITRIAIQKALIGETTAQNALKEASVKIKELVGR